MLQPPTLDFTVAESTLARRMVGALPSGSDVVLAGTIRSLTSALRDERLARLRVRAAVERRRGVRLGSPLVDREFPVVFCGNPHKRWFNAPSAALAHCFWLDGLPEWRQSKGRADASYLEKHRAKLSEVFGRLEDDESRLTFASCIRARTACDAGYYRTALYREYFHPVAQPRRGDTVVDVGAYTGASSIAFRRAVGVSGRVVAMEPSPRNYRKLRLLRGLGVDPVCAGASDTRATSRMKEAGGSSKLGSEGVEVQLLPIDELVRNLRLRRVDVLKYDVEGHEMPALLGATETIRRFRPVVQLSIYHRANDLFELPLWAIQELDDYVFYVGHHNCYHTETDLYAVPRERLGTERASAASRFGLSSQAASRS